MATTYLTRTPSSSGNLRTFTISFWVKKCKQNGGGGTSQQIIGQTNEQYFRLMFLNDTDQFRFYDQAGMSKMTTRRFRDVNSFYHFVVRIDTTQSTASDRCRLYVNGVQETSFSTDTNPGQNVELHFNRDRIHSIGRSSSSGGYDYFDGILSDFMVVDGQSLAPTSFAETDTDTGEWRPKELAANAFTWGTNGFRILKDGITVTDQSTNSNNWTAYGSLTKTNDCPNNVFATFNPLDNYYANATFSYGNTKISSPSGREASSSSTLAMTKGKFYWETKFLTSSAPFVGIQPIPSFNNTASPAVLQLHGLGLLKTGKVETTNGSGGSTVLAQYATFTTNDIIGVALDLDANKIYFYKNGSILGASGVTITDPALTRDKHYMVAVGNISGQDTIEVNFGNGYFGTTAITTNSGNGYAGAEGASKFAYQPRSGHSALSTKGLNQ